MSTQLHQAASPPEQAGTVRLQTRLFSLAVLLGTACLLGWVGVTAARMLSDAWVAPLELSPDSDLVVQLTLRLNRQLAELDQLDAEVARLDEDLEAVATAIERLSSVQHSGRDGMAWQSEVHREESASLARIVAGLRAQKDVLLRLKHRQQGLTDAARADLAAGHLTRVELERQEQALDTLRVSLIENERTMDEALMRQRQSKADSGAYLAGLKGDTAARTLPEGRKPEVAASEERSIRNALELMKLQSEQRHLRNLRRLAAQSLGRERALLEELKVRPLYRAVNAKTEVAFVPYTQLEDVRPGGRILACTWGVFACRLVGTVTEVLPGEVATMDPWGEMARGQYAILKLTEPRAIQEKVLRVRGSR